MSVNTRASFSGLLARASRCFRKSDCRYKTLCALGKGLYEVLARAAAIRNGHVNIRLSAGDPNGSCFAFQLHQCKGARLGMEPIGLHSARLMRVLAKLKLTPWPCPGPIGIVERNPFLDREEVHLVDGWRFLGTDRSEAELHKLLQAPGTSAIR